VNPRLGRGSVTNQEAPEANAAAEWKTTSPATRNPAHHVEFRPPAAGRRKGRTMTAWRPSVRQQAQGSAGPLEPDRPVRTG